MMDCLQDVGLKSFSVSVLGEKMISMVSGRLERRGEVVRQFILAFFGGNLFCSSFSQVGCYPRFQILHPAGPVICSSFRLPAGELDGPVRRKAHAFRDVFRHFSDGFSFPPALCSCRPEIPLDCQCPPDRPPVTSYFSFIIFVFLCFCSMG